MNPNDSQAEQPSQTPQVEQPQPAAPMVQQPQTPVLEPIPEHPEIVQAEEKRTVPTAQKHARPSFPFVIVAAVILFLVVVYGAVYAYCRNNHKSLYTSSSSKSSSASWDTKSSSSTAQTYSYCTPTGANSLDESVAVTAYRNFVMAVRTKNQSCANELSSVYFLNESKLEFNASDGDWITAQHDGIQTIWDGVNQLPTSLQYASFTQDTYDEPTISGQKANTTGPTSGLTLNYPFSLDGDRNEKYEISVSFVLDNGKVLVDNIVEQPQS